MTLLWAASTRSSQDEHALDASRAANVDAGDPIVTGAAPIAQLQPQLVRAVHDRRARWAVRMPRRLEEFSLRLTTLDDQLRGAFGRSPTVAELAKAAGVETGEAVRAIVAGRASTALSLSVPVGEDPDTMFGDTMAHPEAVLSAAYDRGFITRGLESLEERERHILELHFFRWAESVPYCSEDRDLADAGVASHQAIF